MPLVAMQGVSALPFGSAGPQGCGGQRWPLWIYWRSVVSSVCLLLEGLEICGVP